RMLLTPRSPLFPYTTLFRSRSRHERALVRGADADAGLAVALARVRGDLLPPHPPRVDPVLLVLDGGVGAHHDALGRLRWQGLVVERVGDPDEEEAVAGALVDAVARDGQLARRRGGAARPQLDPVTVVSGRRSTGDSQFLRFAHDVVRHDDPRPAHFNACSVVPAAFVSLYDYVEPAVDVDPSADAGVAAGAFAVARARLPVDDGAARRDGLPACGFEVPIEVDPHPLVVVADVPLDPNPVGDAPPVVPDDAVAAVA